MSKGLLALLTTFMILALIQPLYAEIVSHYNHIETSQTDVIILDEENFWEEIQEKPMAVLFYDPWYCPKCTEASRQLNLVDSFTDVPLGKIRCDYEYNQEICELFHAKGRLSMSFVYIDMKNKNHLYFTADPTASDMLDFVETAANTKKDIYVQKLIDTTALDTPDVPAPVEENTKFSTEPIPQHVIHANPDNFLEILKRENSIVFFEDNTCGHCLEFARSFYEAAELITPENTVAQLVSVNCNDPRNDPFCKDLYSKGYKTVLFVSPSLYYTKYIGKDLPSSIFRFSKRAKPYTPLPDSVIGHLMNHLNPSNHPNHSSYSNHPETPNQSQSMIENIYRNLRHVFRNVF